MKRLLALVVLLFVVALGLSFAAVNTESVTVHFYVGDLNAPLSLVIVIALAFGALLGILASLGVVLSTRFEASSLRKRVNLCERELKNLRELPFKDQ
ncbi:MAG: lipopolysaccharide assembly LapA domain-containing protein [Thiohalomonadaceae bacterium]